MGADNLDKIFRPKSIAVIGASNTVGSAGYRIFRNLIGSGWQGIAYPVNPGKESIQGVQAYPTVFEIPRIVDLAIIATPAKTVKEVLEQCGKRGINGILIISAGFKEVGEQGRLLEKELWEIKEKYNLRIVGPNCVGFILPYLNLNATFAGLIMKRACITPIRMLVMPIGTTSKTHQVPARRKSAIAAFPSFESGKCVPSGSTASGRGGI